MRVLLVRAGALGDVLLLRRAVAGLTAGGCEVTLLAPAAAGSALVGPGGSEVGGLIPWDRAEISTLLTEAGPSGALAAALASFSLAIAYTRTGALVRTLERLVPEVTAQDPTPPAGSGHAAAWLARPVSARGVRVPDEPPCLEATPEERAEAAALFPDLEDGFLALHPGSGSAGKNWPPGNFLALARRLSPRRTAVLIEGPADEGSVARFRGEGGFAWARHLRPRLLGALLGRAGLYVGNDSGVSHLAAAWGAPTLALFGPTEAPVWAPLGPRVRVVASPTPAMADLPLGTVLAAAWPLTP